MAVYIVIGASRGIGFELAAQLVRRGDRVIATYRDDAGRTRLDALAAAGGDAVRIRLDVRDSASIEALRAGLGDAPVDVLVHSAGVMGSSAPLDAVDYDEWLQVFLVNVQGPHRVIAALLPNLQRSQRPRVITLSSIMGSLSRRSPGHIAYRSSKAAVNKVMQVLATELAGRGIIACPVHPGWVQTEMGGPGAELAVRDSAAGLIALIDRLAPEHAGRFWQWDGSELPW